MRVFMKNMNRFVIVGILLSLTACKHWWGGDDEEDNPFQGVTATQLYADSKNNVGLKIRLSEEGGIDNIGDFTVDSDDLDKLR